MLKHLTTWFRSRRAIVALLKENEAQADLYANRMEAMQDAVVAHKNECETAINNNARVVAALVLACGGKVAICKDIAEMVKTTELSVVTTAGEDGGVVITVTEPQAS